MTTITSATARIDSGITADTNTTIVAKKHRISARRQHTDNLAFNGLSVRAQKIVRRMAFGDELIYNDLRQSWVLVNCQDVPYMCKVKAKDAINISFMANVHPISFHVILADVRRHFTGGAS